MFSKDMHFMCSDSSIRLPNNSPWWNQLHVRNQSLVGTNQPMIGWGAVMIQLVERLIDISHDHTFTILQQP